MPEYICILLLYFSNKMLVRLYLKIKSFINQNLYLSSYRNQISYDIYIFYDIGCKSWYSSDRDSSNGKKSTPSSSDDETIWMKPSGIAIFVAVGIILIAALIYILMQLKRKRRELRDMSRGIVICSRNRYKFFVTIHLRFYFKCQQNFKIFFRSRGK